MLSFSPGSHTYDKIVTAIKAVIEDFRLEGKVQTIVTDNGLNFVKAMTTYFASINLAAEAANVNEGNDLSLDGLSASDVNIYEILENGSRNSPAKFWFASHIRCAAHTLNLLASTDVDKVLQAGFDNQSLSGFSKAFDKVKELWNLCNRSTKAADTCVKIISMFINVKLYEYIY